MNPTPRHRASLALLPLLCLCLPLSAQEVEEKQETTATTAAEATEATAEGDAAAATDTAPAAAPVDPEAAAVAADPVSGALPTEERSTLRAQVLLERAHFSPGEIDGKPGSNLSRALAGFQLARGLDADGRLGPKTWAELERDSAPTLVDYTVQAADLEGPFVKLPQGMPEQAKLPALGFASVTEAMGERFHAHPDLLRSLNQGKRLDLAGEVIRVPNVADLPALPAGHHVIVDKSDRTVMLADAEGKVLAQFPASTGSKHDPLPIGTWKINGVAMDPTFSYNPDLFWDADPSHEKAKLAAGPNNPVGRVWIDLSKEHYGIHGTPNPTNIGKTESHGCIRLTNWSAVLLGKAVKPGMEVVMRE